MGVSIKGIRFNTITINLTGDEEKITGEYALISSLDKVLAKQGFNSYNNMELKPSPETQRLLDSFVASFRADVDKILGLADLDK